MTTGTRTANSAPSTEVSATVSSSGDRSPCRGRRCPARTSTGSSAAPRGRAVEVHRHDGVEPGLQRLGRNRPERRHRAAPSGWSRTRFELKNAQRVTLEGNLLENCWAAGQYGYAIVLTPRNSGRAPWTRCPARHVHQQHRPPRRRRGEHRRVRRFGPDPAHRARSRSATTCFTTSTTPCTAPGAKAMLVGDGASNAGVRPQHHHPYQQLGPLCVRRRHVGPRLHEQHLAAPSLRHHG